MSKESIKLLQCVKKQSRFWNFILRVIQIQRLDKVKMNLLCNQLVLSSVQLRKSLHKDALDRLIGTSQVYPDNNILKSNISVLKCLNGTEKGQQAEQTAASNDTLIVDALHQSIKSAPLNYIGYYNLFNFCIKKKRYSQGLGHLIQSIAALYLSRALNDYDQKTANLVVKQYCSKSILVYLIKSIIHVRHQKYVLAVTDLNWIVENSHNESDKIAILKFIRIIFTALQQRDKENQVEEKIAKISQQRAQKQQNHQQPQQLTLNCTYQIPTDHSDILKAIQLRLREFSNLLSQQQRGKLKMSNKMNYILFKNINPQKLDFYPTNKEILFSQLKTSIFQSPLYTKSESKKLSRSRRSEQLSVNFSRQFAQKPNKQMAFLSAREDHEKRMNLSFTPIKTDMNPFNTSRDQVENHQMNSSLNFSGFKPKKKTQNIYPLELDQQYVEVKLVMAQLTNNKEIFGQMDPYCIITYNQSKKQSSVSKGGGLQPRWREGFIFKMTPQPSEVVIQVFDKQKFKHDDFIGSGKFMLDKNGFIKVQLYENKKQAGIIFVTVQAKV